MDTAQLKKVYKETIAPALAEAVQLFFCYGDSSFEEDCHQPGSR